MASHGSRVPNAGSQIDRLVMPLLALLLLLGIVSFVSIFTDHYTPSWNSNTLTGHVVSSTDFALPVQEKVVSPERFDFVALGPNLVESGSHVLINLYGTNFVSHEGLITVNIYDRPYFGRKLVMQFNGAVHTSTHASFYLPADLESGHYFITLGEGSRESTSEGITVH